MNTAEKIYEKVKMLPEPAVQEVLDFVEFLKTDWLNQKNMATLRKQQTTGGLTSSYHSRAYPTCHLSNRAVATFCRLRRTP